MLLDKESLKIHTELYNLKLHEFLRKDGMTIIRVDGGWIYYYHVFDSTGIFVPERK